MLRKFPKAVFMLFFPSFILLLMCCAVCEPAFAENTFGTPPNTVALFEPERTQFAEKNNVGKTKKKNFQTFAFPSVSYVGGVLVVFAQAKTVAGDTPRCDIVEGYFKLKDNGELSDKFVETAASTHWTKRALTNNNEDNCTGSPTALVGDENIYLFFRNSDYTSNSKWEYNFMNGAVKNDDNTNSIFWNSPSAILNYNLKFESSGKIYPVFGGSSGIVFDNTLVVPLSYTKNDDLFFSTFIKSSKTNGQTWELVLSEDPAEGTKPAIVKWDNKLIMMTSNKGYRKVYESADMGTTWKEAVLSLSRVWGNTEERDASEYSNVNGFITAKIGEGEKKEVMLVTHVAWSDDGKYELHLWMTDYKRVYDVGAISAEADPDIFSTLLYAEENLFAAYEQWDDNKITINVVHLKDQLERIKNVLKTWNECDVELSESCFAADGSLTSGDMCTNKIPVKGLVGYLSGNYSNNDWNDEYLCVSATVNGGANVKNGLRFSGAGAGAVWPVGAQGQNQRYHFANYAFTLVATVKIDGDANNNNKENSILGLNYIKNSKNLSFGLWCTQNGDWRVSEEEEGELGRSSFFPNCNKNKLYEVALTLRDEKFSLYINGEKIKESADKAITAQQELSITHFYFGADNNAQTSTTVAESYVTVTNVLLYNRPFDDRGIMTLKNYDIPNTEKKTDIKKKEQLFLRLEDSAVRVGAVGVLCFMFFSVFTLLGRYI